MSDETAKKLQILYDVGKLSAVDALPDNLWAEVTADPEYLNALNIWKHIAESRPVNFSDFETRYIIMHLVNILRRG